MKPYFFFRLIRKEFYAWMTFIFYETSVKKAYFFFRLIGKEDGILMHVLYFH